MRKSFVFALFLLCKTFSCGLALDYAPWFERTFEIRGGVSAFQQAYSSVNAEGSTHYSSKDYFFTGNLAIPLLDVIGAEIEGGLFSTPRHSFGVSHLSFMGRYSWMSDTIGDPCSLMVGARLSQVFKKALNDISLFYHGGIEFEPFVSIGKEVICEEFWISRAWGLLAMGIADHGYPWVRANAQWDTNCWDTHQWSIFIRSLWGCGSRSLRIRSFHGYGTIQHQSIDIGGSYQYLLCSEGFLGVEGSFRVFARNCPRLVSCIAISFYYPFGI